MERIMNEGFEPEEQAFESEDSVETSVEETAEQTTDDNAEDMLLVEIDAFRSKAAQLQQLIVAKETKAAELEALVREKEMINQQLQDELAKKQQEADTLVTDVESQVDRMMQVVKGNMDALEDQIKNQVSNNHESYQQNAKTLSDTLKGVEEGLDSIQSELAEKTHSESVHLYRLIQDSLKEHDNTEALAQASLSQYKSLKSLCTVLTVVSILSLAAGIASLLLALGII